MIEVGGERGNKPSRDKDNTNVKVKDSIHHTEMCFAVLLTGTSNGTKKKNILLNIL